MSEILRSLELVANHPDFHELREEDGFKLDLRYAGTNNFTGQDLYGPFRRAFLHKIAAEKLRNALQALKAEKPGYRFVIFDALRPRSVQRLLWRHVEGSESEAYVAHPDRGSMHNYGFAVDLSVIDEHGRELDMGSGFDDFRPLSQPRLEEQFLASGELTPEQVENRRILRRAMEKAGFLPIPHEWWHFDALDRTSVQSRFKLIE